MFLLFNVLLLSSTQGFEAAWADTQQPAGGTEQRLETARQQQQLAARRQANAQSLVVLGEVLRILRRPVYALSLRQCAMTSCCRIWHAMQ